MRVVGALFMEQWYSTVPDESFLEGRTNVYEALNQRLATVFENELNPTGVKIDLENPDTTKRILL